MNNKISVIVNASSNLAVNFGVNILSFITLPLYIAVFGKAEYGIFLLAYGIAASMIFFDFGIGSAIVKYTAKEGEKGREQDGYLEFINWALKASLILSAILAFLCFLIADNTTWIFNINDSNEHTASTLFKCFAAYTFLYCTFRQGQYFLEGKNEFLLINKVKLITLVGLIGTWIYVYFNKPSIIEFSLLFMAASIIPYAVYFMIWIRSGTIRRKYWTGRELVSWPEKHYLGLTGNLFVIQLSSFLTSLADKFIIGAILGPTAVVYYTAVTKIAYMVRMVNNQSLLVLNPLISKAKSPDSPIIGKILDQGAVTQFILMLPICTAAALMLDPFLNLWLGEDFQQYSYWGVVALIVYVLGPFSAMTQRVMKLSGHHNLCMKTNLILVAINLATSIILTYWLGIGGPIIGTIIQAALSVWIYSHYKKRYFKATGTLGAHMMIKSTAVTGVIGATAYIALHHTSINSWSGLIVFGAVITPTLLLYSAIVLLRHSTYRLSNVRHG